MKYLLLICLLSCASVKKHDKTLAHKCDFLNCSMTGYIFFRTDYEEGTDGYLYDLTHWEHPEFTNEQIDDYMWSTFERGTQY